MEVAGFGSAAFGAGGGVEQPGFEFDCRRLRAGWIDTQFGPQILDGTPVAEQPAAVFVGAVALGLPLRAGREQTRVARHVKLGGVADAPAAGAVVAEQHRVGVDLLQYLQVAAGLDFEDGAALGTEALHLCARVGGDQAVGVLPVVEAAAHERGADRLGGSALLHDDRIELVAPVNWKNLVAVFDAEQPFPAAVIEQQAAQCAGAVVGIEAGGHDEPQPAAAFQQAVSGFEEELVEVEVGRALMAERVARIAEAGGAAARLAPAVMQGPVFVTARRGEPILTLVVLVGVAERAGGMAHEVGLGAEPRAVIQPRPLHGFVNEVAGLAAHRLLFAVGAIERIDPGKELHGGGLGDVPRRIAEDGVEARSRLAEHVGELQLPVEEAQLAGDARGDRPGLRRRRGEAGRQRGAGELVGRPEPAGAPAVHRLFQRLPRR